MNTAIVIAIGLVLLAAFVLWCLHTRKAEQEMEASFQDHAREVYRDAGLNWYPIGNGEWRRVDR